MLYVPRSYAQPRSLIRQFDTPRVAGLVECNARTYHLHYCALDGYDDPDGWDLADVIPPGPTPMRERVRRGLGDAAAGRHQVLEEIVRATFLAPCRTTIIQAERFVVVSPSVSVAQLERGASGS